MTYEITPLSKKSFYGKCKVEVEGNTKSLRSYNTIVATYNIETDKVTVNGWYSATTARHINAFLYHLGKDTMCKKEMDS
jgi:hypothetical protein